MAINLTEVPAEVPDAQTERATRMHERDATQIMLDGVVKDMAEKWTAAGKPDFDPGTDNFKRYEVKADDKRDLKRAVGRACTLHKVAPGWFKDLKQDNGSYIIKFTVIAPPAKAATTAATGETPAADAPAAEQPEQPEQPEAPASDEGERPAGRRGGRFSGR